MQDALEGCAGAGYEFRRKEMKKFLRRLHNIWLWFVAIVFTIAGFVAFCVVVGLIVIGIRKLVTGA